tara:strand:+ start:1036 stop:2169 length:1134 start_codon:yes stop_codon:yes gene_type:complete
MHGLESLDQFKSFVSSLGGLGRFEDTYVVHAAEGETVVPMEVLDRNPVLKKRLFKTMVDMGIEPGRYIVGNELNSINPVTGQPEFFLKKIVKGIRKAIPGDLEQYLGPIVGLATGNPFLGAIAGGIGSGMSGAISGGLGGFRSPGIKGLGGGFGREFLSGGLGNKINAMDIGELFDKGGLSRFFLGDKDAGGLLGKFDFRGTGADKTTADLLKEGADLKAEAIAEGFTEEAAEEFALGQLEKAAKAKSAVLGGMSIGDAAKLFGLGTAGITALIKLTEPEAPGVSQFTPPTTDKQIFPTSDVLFPQGGMAKGGGVTDLRSGGMSLGPGTETSDDIPAMLSDGEFVMTAKAVRGAGGGDRREGAKRMYQMMDSLEGKA